MYNKRYFFATRTCGSIVIDYKFAKSRFKSCLRVWFMLNLNPDNRNEIWIEFYNQSHYKSWFIHGNHKFLSSKSHSVTALLYNSNLQERHGLNNQGKLKKIFRSALFIIYFPHHKLSLIAVFFPNHYFFSHNIFVQQNILFRNANMWLYCYRL